MFFLKCFFTYFLFENVLVSDVSIISLLLTVFFKTLNTKRIPYE